MTKFHEEIFLDAQTSDSLVIDLQRYTSKEHLSDIHGGRFILRNTSDEFKDLLSKSEPWNKLYRKLSSNEFLSSCMEHLEMSSGAVELNPYLSQRIIPQKLQRVDALKHKRIRETSFIAMPVLKLPMSKCAVSPGSPSMLT